MNGASIFVTAGIACIFLASSTVANNKPVPPGYNQPPFLKSYTEQLYSNNGSTSYVTPFKGNKGVLRAVSGTFTGSEVIKLKIIGPIGSEFALSVSCYAYDLGTQVSVNMTGSASGKSQAGLQQLVSVKEAGAGSFDAEKAKQIFKGPNSIGMHMTCDGPKFSKGASLFQVKSWGTSSFGGSVTYTYLPAPPPLRLPGKQKLLIRH